MSQDQENGLPESTRTRIKHAIFKILKLPIDGIEYATAHIEKEAGNLILKIKTDINEERINIHNFIEHHRFSRDAVNYAENKKEFIFTPPESLKPELLKLEAALNPEEGLINKDDHINKLLDNLDSKIEQTNRLLEDWYIFCL
jgi:cellobiose phosphorylase